MKNIIIIVLSLVLLSCSEQNHFISNKAYLNTVKSDFEKVKKVTSNRKHELYDVFNEKMSLEEKEALMFLYAYMPLNDLADYQGEFFLNNVRLAFKTRETFNWGNKIPEDIFRHFVLPYRVNNENLDSSRSVFFNELSVRLKGMELKEAILEVNHWCHEKVNYQPTDERTISPLGAIKSTYGRCGEESTFTVTAMRAAGIPARQCYTPRWAHTDDNHAWVEVWVDGQWHYLGACEPEANLDIAWFSAPALRAMLVNSNVFGKYEGPEEIILKEEKYTRINMLSNYAPVKTIYAKVINQKNEIVKDATVEFQLYNYAEFYPLAKKQVNQKGIASLMTGFGDLIIWAYSNNDYAYEKITVEKTDTVILKIHPQEGKEYTNIFDIVPPIAKDPKSVSAEGDKQNKKRLTEEDSIREAYACTFMKQIEAEMLATNYHFNPQITWPLIEKSKGNYNEIAEFIRNSDQEKHEYSVPFLQAIAPKDLRDAESSILLSQINHSFTYAGDLPTKNKTLFVHFILNPRIANEKLIAYKAYLQQAFGETFIQKTKKDIKHLITWINSEITIDSKANYYQVPITAKGVYELKSADSYSRDLFFVASCRSFGIPSRLEPTTKTPQHFDKEWITVSFEANKTIDPKQTGTLILLNNHENNTALKYRTHFALSKFEKGKYETLDYGWDVPMNEMDRVLTLEVGNYLLITGNRQMTGNVLTKMEFFNINAGEQKKIDIKLRTNNEKISSIAQITIPDTLVCFSENNQIINKNRTHIIGFIDPGKEPSKHTLVDLEKLASSFDKLESDLYLCINNLNVNELNYKLPLKTKYLHDQHNDLLKHLSIGLGKGLTDLPVFLILKNDKVYFLSEGYTIGVGEQMIKTIQSLD